MSESEDEIPMQEVRQAVQRAANDMQRGGSMAAAPRPSMPDVYQREAKAILQPGQGYDDVLERVTLGMGLKPERRQGNTQLWLIKQSPKWIALEAVFCNNVLTSWALLHTNGAD